MAFGIPTAEIKETLAAARHSLQELDKGLKGADDLILAANQLVLRLTQLLAAAEAEGLTIHITVGKEPK